MLDFGLAKAFTGDAACGSSAELSQSPTLARTGTAAGLILGTAAYMSPEQARGRAVDKRADIWAFGVVLFEMLSGRRLFMGETVSDVLAAVLTREPDWAALPAGAPGHLRLLLRRCLERDPKNRMRDIGDARLELQAALDRHGPDASLATTPARAPRAGVLLAALGGGLLLGALLAVGVGRFDAAQARAATTATTWLEVGPPVGRFGIQTAPSISPDGRQIAFWAPNEAGQVSLWIRALDSPGARVLPGTTLEGGYGGVPAFWSPDGRSLGFFAAGKLKRLDLDGGAALTLADATNPRGGCWGTTGVIVFVPAAGRPLYRISASGGEATPLPLSSAYPNLSWPHCLPDGRHVLLTVVGGDGGVWLTTLDGTEHRQLSKRTSRMEYADGHVFFGDKGSLFAQPFDERELMLSGEPVRVADSLGSSFGDLSAWAFSVSERGALVFWSGQFLPVTQLTWFSRTGRRLGTVGEPGAYVGFEPSPTGRQAAIERFDSKIGEVNIWLMDLSTGVASKFSSGPGRQAWSAGTPVWSPAGDRVLFATFPGVAAQSLRGGGPEKLLDDFGWLSDISPDGQHALLTKNDPVTSSDLWMLSFSGDKTPKQLPGDPTE